MNKNLDLLKQDIEKALADVSPAMNADGGGLTLAHLDEEHICVRLVGACRFCPSQELTINQTILPRLRSVIPQYYSVSVER